MKGVKLNFKHMKDMYRNMLQLYSPMINLSYFCRLTKVNKSALSQFLKGDQGAISEDRLQELCLAIDRYITIKHIDELLVKDPALNY